MEYQDVLDAVSSGESADWEFKSAKGGFPASVWETYSAMANTDGGTIVLGITESNGAFVVEGLKNPAQILKSCWDTVNNRGKVSVNLLAEKDASLVDIEGNQVLVIRVPRAGRRQRPVELTKMLQSLASRGFLEQVGQKRGSSYRLPGWASPEDQGTSPVPQTASPLAPRASPIAQATSPLAPENDEQLLDVAKPARDKKKLIPSLTRTIIRRLCSERFLTAEQLGNLMERRKDKLQENFLASMVAAGELCLRFPEQITHPDQAYRTQPDWREE